MGGYFQRFEAARTWRSFQVLLRRNVKIARTTKLNTPVHSIHSTSCQQNFKTWLWSIRAQQHWLPRNRQDAARATKPKCKFYIGWASIMWRRNVTMWMHDSTSHTLADELGVGALTCKIGDLVELECRSNNKKWKLEPCLHNSTKIRLRGKSS